ncbi:hypothetical protein IH979_03505 [Patescibacteria group bacterium]|nr:hypothetical protein [Patescibacteria group bacterium]
MEKLLLKLLQPIAKIIVRLLQKHIKKTGIVPAYYFHRFARVYPQAAYELIIFRKSDRGLEVFLKKRPQDDPEWPNEWHFSGTIVRNDDKDEAIWKRLAREHNLEEFSGQPRFAYNEITKNKRCTTLHAIYYLVLDQSYELPAGKIFPVTDLPSPMLEHQIEQIQRMVKYLQSKTRLTFS